MKTAIYVVTHKQKVEPISDIYVPIQVGRFFSKEKIEKISDDLGDDNIAEKNKNFCELTAHYWMWKNIKDCDFVGLCHYRRFFTECFPIGNRKKIMSEDKLNKLLGKYEVILPKKRYYTFTLNHQFYGQKNFSGYKKDIETLKSVIQELYPEYLEDFDGVMKGYSASFCNMFIMSRDNFCAYSEWLFSILFEVEKRVDISDYAPVQARLFGYLSERLLNVWAMHNKLKVKECWVVNTEETDKEFLARQYFYLKNRIRLLINFRIDKDNEGIENA